MSLTYLFLRSSFLLLYLGTFLAVCHTHFPLSAPSLVKFMSLLLVNFNKQQLKMHLEHCALIDKGEKHNLVDILGEH